MLTDCYLPRLGGIEVQVADLSARLVARGHEVDNRAAKLIFTRLASTNNDTLTSYLSLLMTSGLDTWDNRAIDAATAQTPVDGVYYLVVGGLEGSPDVTVSVGLPHDIIAS